MSPLLVVQESLRDIFSHKLRSALTILGVVFGVASLATMFAITASMAFSLKERLVQTGDFEKLIIRGAAPPDHQVGLADISPGITYQDAIALRKASPFITWVSPIVNHNAHVSYQGEGIHTRIAGSEPEFLLMDVHQIAVGRGITPLDLENKHRVAVLGSQIWQRLFRSPEQALGKTIAINGESFRVVGCLPHYQTAGQLRAEASGVRQRQLERQAQRGGRRGRGWDAFPWKNNVVLIPLTTMQAVFKSARMDTGIDLGPDPYLNDIQVGVTSFEHIKIVEEHIRNALLAVHRGIEDFAIESKLEEISKVEEEVWRIRFSGALVAGIGLIVGGIGITNIMLASIVDRIREIGIRLAVGARPSDIFFQVVTESILLAFFGGLLGIAATFGLVAFLIHVAQIANPPMIEPIGLAISFSFALITGIFAGIYPAVKAASLRPVQALKFD